jgi:hypothetical protein
LLAWATVKDHQGIQELVDRLNAGPPEQGAPSGRLHAEERQRNHQVVSADGRHPTRRKLTADADDPQRLVVWAKPADHTNIESDLQEIDVEAPRIRPHGRDLFAGRDGSCGRWPWRFVPLDHAVPDASFSPGAREGQMLAFATAKDHQRIAALVEQLTKAPPPEQAPAAAVYTVKFITATRRRTSCAKAVPKSQVHVDPADTARMTVWASPADQATIKSILEQIDVEGEAGGSNVEVYQLEGGLTATSAAYALRLLAHRLSQRPFLHRHRPGPDRRLGIGQGPRRDQSIDRADERRPATRQGAPSWSCTTWSSSMPPRRRPCSSCGRAASHVDARRCRAATLTVWATPDDHKAIEDRARTIDVEEAAESDRTVVIYSLRDMNPSSVTYVWRFLASAVPNARLTPGAEPEQLVAWASPRTTSN